MRNGARTNFSVHIFASGSLSLLPTSIAVADMGKNGEW